LVSINRSEIAIRINLNIQILTPFSTEGYFIGISFQTKQFINRF
jgi:hypothetical protein